MGPGSSFTASPSWGLAGTSGRSSLPCLTAARLQCFSPAGLRGGQRFFFAAGAFTGLHPKSESFNKICKFSGQAFPMKRKLEDITAIPSKRLYYSIIADYDLNKAISELIDNAIDVWIKKEKTKQITIDVELDEQRQLISVKDNAGGIKRHELPYIIAPGQTSNAEDFHTIGIFGVGTKRAVVAIAKDIKIKTGADKKLSYLVEFDDHWLKEQDDWTLPIFEIDEVLPNQTLIELSRLRTVITVDKIEQLKDHLACTYAKFVQTGKIIIRLNKAPVSPITFENWAYPPKFGPREYVGNIATLEGSPVNVHVLAGLSLESSPTGGEYGVYFYCNDRLIVKGLKTFDVGFATKLAGKPHPKLSLTRIIVSLSGEARLMPWNSSKSGINTDHEIFIALQSWLIRVVTDYASLSRRFQGDWPGQVFKYPSGEVEKITIDDFPTATSSYLPPLPLSKPRYSEKIKQKNKNITKAKPWARGSYESIIAVDLIFKQNLIEKNRICLILLDSALEIGFKDYLVNESGKFYSDSDLLRIFGKRHLVHQEIQPFITIDPPTWKRIKYFYGLRCELIHKKTSANIIDDDIIEFRGIVENTLKKLFNLKF
jgi:hypothetical protein